MGVPGLTRRNGEVAQRVADIVFTAFKAMSGSHGSMNGTHLMYKKWTWAETSAYLSHNLDSSLTCQPAGALLLDRAGTVNPPRTQT